MMISCRVSLDMKMQGLKVAANMEKKWTIQNIFEFLYVCIKGSEEEKLNL